MRQENSLEKKQIEQLMMKLKEKDNIQNDLEKEMSEASETLSFIAIKLKVSFILNLFLFYFFQLLNFNFKKFRNWRKKMRSLIKS